MEKEKRKKYIYEVEKRIIKMRRQKRNREKSCTQGNMNRWSAL